MPVLPPPACRPDRDRRARRASRVGAWWPAVLLAALLAGCGDNEPVEPRALTLSCPAGLVLIHAASYPSGPWHTPLPRGADSYDPDATTSPNLAIDAKPTLLALPGYCIDRQPFTPAGGAAAVSREQAEAACKARGLRLCSPYEWELACRGRELARFPYGNRFDPQCGGGDPAAGRCGSSFGIYDQLGGAPEWVLGPLMTDSTSVKENADYRAQMGGVQPSEEPGSVDCLTLRLEIPAAKPVEGTVQVNPSATLGLAPVAAIRCCSDPQADSTYILDYDR